MLYTAVILLRAKLGLVNGILSHYKKEVLTSYRQQYFSGHYEDTKGIENQLNKL